VVTGSPTIGTTTPGTLVPANNVMVIAPLGGIFGNQTTLTSGDDINLAGTNNSLNATFNGSTKVVGVTVEGVQSWTVGNVDSSSGHLVDLSLGDMISGMTSLTYNDFGFGNGLEVGSKLDGISTVFPTTGFDLIVNSASGTGGGPNHFVDLVFTAASFPTAGSTINVTANGVGDLTDTKYGSDQYSFDHAYSISAGSTSATSGFTTWNVDSMGALVGAVNDLALGADGSHTATTLNITDDGSSTIIWASKASGSTNADWADLVTINASGTTGQLTITGGENGSTGLLGDGGSTNDLTTVTGGSGADIFDLSNYSWSATQLATLSITGATGTTYTADANAFTDPDWASGYAAASGQGLGSVVELSCSEIATMSGVAAGTFVWADVTTLYDVAEGKGLGTVSGTINMANFTGTDIVTLANTHSGNYVDAGAISVTNAPDGFIFNFQDVQTAGDFSIVGVGGVGDTATVNYGTGYLSTDPVGDTGSKAESFSTTGIDNVDVNVFGAAKLETSFNAVYLGDIVATANSTGAEVLTVDSNVGLGLAYDDTGHFAHLSVTTLGLFGGTFTPGTVLPPSLPTYSETGTLDLTGSGDIWLGVTNATTITESGTGHLFMEAPDDAIDYGTNAGTASANITGDTVMADSKGSILQGTMDGLGPIAGITVADAVGNDSLTGVSSDFYGDGGADMMWLSQDKAGDANSVYFGEYYLNGSSEFLPIGGGGAAALGFWDATHNGEALTTIFTGTGVTGGTSADITDVNGFTVGSDNLNFNVDAWNFGLNTTHGDLVDGVALTPIADANASGSTLFLGTPGITLGTGGGVTTSGHVDLILDGINDATFANAAALAAAIATTGVGNFILGTPLGNNHQVDLLVAYYTGTEVNIADVELQNSSGSTQTNTGAMTHVYASDMISLVGVSSLTSLGTTANAAHIVFDHIA
jgi:hypothetical protein